MRSASQDKTALHTSAGDFALDEYCFRFSGKEWKILHVGAVLSHEDESLFLLENKELLPYGVSLWAAAIALAYEIASRASEFRNKRVLELGAGTGLPGIVAASESARVLQTDKSELAISLCRRNAALNGAENIEQRLADWADWNNNELFDWILGSDILYLRDMHSRLRDIFETNLAVGGKVLLSDPFRGLSLSMLERLEKDGWSVTMSKRNIGKEKSRRNIGVFELAWRGIDEVNAD